MTKDGDDRWLYERARSHSLHIQGICGLKCGRNTVYMGSLLPGVYNIGDNGDDGRIYKRMQSSLSHLEELVG